jgi:ribosome-associated protein
MTIAPHTGSHTLDERPSKTQAKKAMHALQELGAALAELPDDRLHALPLDPALLQAIHEYRRTRSHEGRRRQMQYIGKLMRSADADAIRDAVATFRLGPARETLALHRAERWRVDLVASDDALARWLDEHPDGDAQRLRNLVRAARREAPSQPGERHGRAWRELFRFLRDAPASPDNATGSVDD